MTFGKLVSAFVAAALVGTPATAAGVHRSSAPDAGESEIAGNPWIPIAVMVGVIAIILFVVFDDDDESVSA